MARSQSRFRSQRTGAARRRVSWVIGPTGLLQMTATSNNLFATATQLVADDLTWIRTRGELLLQMVTASAALDGFRWAFGMAVVTENAAGIGVTAVPNPIDDVSWDGWFVYETGDLRAITTTVASDSPGWEVRVPIDSKAMRKTHATDVVVACFGVVETGTASMQAALSLRGLVKLP